MGSTTVSNRELSQRLGLAPDWFERRTGIVTRRIAGPGQHSLGMAATAVVDALSDAGIVPDNLGHETLMLHIQNGALPRLTPPSAIQLSSYMGLHLVRPLGIDGVCAEPIAALELSELMLEAGRCEQVIVSAAADFLAFVDPEDIETVGLFGAGAGALVAVRSQPNEASALRGLRYETDTQYSDAGVIDVLSVESAPGHVIARTSYYQMKGRQLAAIALRKIPPLVEDVLSQAGWGTRDIDYVIAHQPNVKLLEMGMKRLGLSTAKLALPVRTLGNMGPASLLVALAQARADGAVATGSRVLLVSFGLGFSCGAAAMVL